MKNNLILLLLFSSTLTCQSHKVDSILPCEFIEGLSSADDIRCGKIEVPENHDDPKGNSIQMAYVVLSAKDRNTDAYPMIYLAGGPGSSSLSPARIRRWQNSPLREKRDLILFDQRGIGYSSGLPNINEELFDIFAKNASIKEEQTMMNELVSNYQQKCKNQNIQLQYYNSFQNAKDIGILMKHLGYAKYNIYGVSYGTRLARIVQDLFPSALHSVMLNSPNPIKGDFLIDRLKSYALALGRVFTHCEQNESCNAEFPKLKEQYIQVIQSLKQQPLEIEMEGKIFYVNASDAIYFLRRKLYSNNSRSAIPLLILEYQNGGGSITKSLIENEFGAGYNFSMWLSVERHEMFDPENTAAVIEQVYESIPLLPAKLGLFSTLYLAVENLHSSSLPEKNKKFQMSSVPTMITVNQFDPVTPPENGQIMMKSLANGQLFILDEGGHGGGNDECRNKVMEAFMDAPNSKLDTSCLNLYKE